MAKSVKSAYNDMKKSYKKTINKEKKMMGFPTKRKPYYWEKPKKSYTYRPKKVKEVKIPQSWIDAENEKKQKSGCYIATCVYGSYDCPEVWTLRRFRDYTLDEKWYGRLFIKCYYAISPKLVEKFGEKQWFVNFWKRNLNRLVSDLNNKGISSDRYQDKY